MAILTRTSASIPLFREALTSAGIPCTATDATGFYQRREVQDALDVLGLLFKPEDDLVLSAVLRSPWVGMRSDSLAQMHQQRLNVENPHNLFGHILNAADLNTLQPSEQEKLRRFLGWFKPLPKDMAAGSAYAFFEAMVQASGIEQYAVAYDARNPAAVLANLWKLLDLAHLWDQQRGGGVGRFVEICRYLNEVEAREPLAPVLQTTATSGDAANSPGGAVQLMTVHAAKGLEFPLVVLADLNRTVPVYQGEILVDRDGRVGIRCVSENLDKVDPILYREVTATNKKTTEAEEKRILYVALTRAQEYLHLSGSCGRRKSSSSWMALLEGLQPTNPALGSVK